MRRFLLTAVLLLSFLIGLWPQGVEPLIAGAEDSIVVGGHMELYQRDASGLDLEAVVADEGAWEPAPDSYEPSVGFTSESYWARFRVRAATDDRLLLVHQYANVDRVELALIHEDGRTEHFAAGTLVPYAERSLPNRYPVFPLALDGGETAWCYVHLTNEQGAGFPLAVWREAAYLASDHDEQLVIGLFISVFFVIALFNILFFVATKDRAYLYYVFFVVVYVIFEAALRGIGGEYLWPAWTAADNRIVACSAGLTITTSLLFTRNFLRTKHSAPRLDKILLVGLFASLAIVAAALFVPNRIMVPAINATLFVAISLFISTGIVALRRGFKPARFYALAWSFLLAGSIVYGLLNFGLIASTPFSVNSLTLGATVQVLLLSLAVMDRILLLRRDSERMQKERLDAVERMLYFDSLTQLPNRNRLIADLILPEPVTLILVNIDGFKEINDSFGQKVGDFVIAELGRRVAAVMTPRNGRVYRLHADEFAGLVEKPLSASDLDAIARELIAVCQDRSYGFDGELFRLEVSAGIAICADRHLEKADMALSESRSSKKIIVHGPELGVIKRFADNLHWLGVIRDSLESDRVVPFFQPILDNRSGKIRKYESLMRILAPSGDVIPPGQFLGVAKKSKIYPELSRVMIRKTTDLMASTSCEVSINLSLEDILNAGVRSDIAAAAARPGIAERLIFEILESEGIENFSEVTSFISEVKALGCRIAIDDFGTGYSNFDYLLKMNVDFVKIAAPLIKFVDSDRNSRCITETIADFSRKLGILTVAEFVHSEAVQSVVRELGIDYSQGYFIAQPGPAMRPEEG